MTQTKQRSRRPRRERALGWLYKTLMHTCGVLGVAFVTALLIGGTSHWMFMAGSQDRGMFLSENMTNLGLHLGLSAATWGILYLGIVMIAGRGRRKTKRVIKKARGTVMTETLIMLLPFMLLTSGLAQLTINNIAGVMTHLAAYQAGRAAWLWGSESGSNRGGSINMQRKARVAAAAAVAPVAPGSVRFMPSNDEEINGLANIMFAQFTPGGLGSILGNAARPLVLASTAGDAGGQQDYTFTVALDTSPFAIRAAKKLYFAYGAIELENTSAGGTTVIYHHLNVFPWFGWIFGSPGVKNGHFGYYSAIRRNYQLTPQVSPQ